MLAIYVGVVTITRSIDRVQVDVCIIWTDLESVGNQTRQLSGDELVTWIRKHTNRRGFVPNVRQSLYSEIIVTLAVEPQAAVGKDQDELPVATGLPRTWDDIAPGHLVIAQEALDYGWWEAIVIGRDGDMFTLRFRDYPKLPKFARHRTALALISPPAE